MADDFRLLFHIVFPELSAGLQVIIISTKGMADEGQENALLMLPDMDHFVNEQPLQVQIRGTVIVTEFSTPRMKPQIAIGRHCHVFWLKRPPFPVENADLIIVYGITKNRSAQTNFSA